MAQQLALSFDAAAWRPDRVEILAQAGDVRAIDVATPDVKCPYESDTFENIEGGDVIRFVPQPLAFMQELHRVARPGATASFVLPHAASDDAYMPNVWSKPYTPVSFVYFGQPAYRRADYGYRGDWEILEAYYAVQKTRFGDVPHAELERVIHNERNAVVAFLINLRACKPIRPPGGDLTIRTGIIYI